MQGLTAASSSTALSSAMGRERRAACLSDKASFKRPLPTQAVLVLRIPIPGTPHTLQPLCCTNGLLPLAWRLRQDRGPVPSCVPSADRRHSTNRDWLEGRMEEGHEGGTKGGKTERRAGGPSDCQSSVVPGGSGCSWLRPGAHL